MSLLAGDSLTPAGLQQALAPWLPAPRVWVAFSGGLDSTVLLHLLATRPKASPLPLAAIHVDHGLHPDSAAWAEHCRRVCAALGVPLTIRRLSLRRRPGESLEALAREGRYAILRELTGPGDLVLTAQHQDDQAETLLLALLRGSGVKGLAAMPQVAPLGQARLLRPLLGHTRARLLAWARAQGLRWLDDPSNADPAFDRNFLRTRVMPLLAERWPACTASLSRSAAHCAAAQGLIEGQAAAELPRLVGSRPGALSLNRLAALEPALRAAVLRYWIAGLGLPSPDSRHLGRIQDELLTARPDRQPLVAWPGAEARRYRDDLHVMAPLPAVPAAPDRSEQPRLPDQATPFNLRQSPEQPNQPGLPGQPDAPVRIDLAQRPDQADQSYTPPPPVSAIPPVSPASLAIRPQPVTLACSLRWRRGDLLLPAGLGQLRLVGRDGGAGQDPETRWPGGLEVRFTGEALSCRPGVQGHHRRLKHLFQEAGIPPWLRPYVPRLFADGQLIAVGDFWRCMLDTAAAVEDWVLVWQGGIRDHPGFG